MNQTATTIVEEFEAEFYSTITNQTLEELATDYGTTIDGRDSVEYLINRIDGDFIVALFQHKPFQDLPVLGIYENEKEVCLLLEAVSTGRCCDCNQELTVYASIIITVDGYINFCYYAVPSDEITPVEKCNVRDMLKTWKSNP